MLAETSRFDNESHGDRTNFWMGHVVSQVPSNGWQLTMEDYLRIPIDVHQTKKWVSVSEWVATRHTRVSIEYMALSNPASMSRKETTYQMVTINHHQTSKTKIDHLQPPLPTMKTIRWYTMSQDNPNCDGRCTELPAVPFGGLRRQVRSHLKQQSPTVATQ